MKKYYKFGEIILALREEYKESKEMLDRLKECINIKSKYSDYSIEASSPIDDDKDYSDTLMRLYVEKRYLDVLKKIQYLKYDWYASYLYRALFEVRKADNGLYELKYDDMLTPVDSRKYKPSVEIVDQERFSQLIDEFLSSDLKPIHHGYLRFNHTTLSIDSDYAYINTPLGADSCIFWNGVYDHFKYSTTKPCTNYLLEDIFSLEIPANRIPAGWLKMLERHEHLFDRETIFKVDTSIRRRTGILEISSIDTVDDNQVVKIYKKTMKK